eukprot:NODE_1837_length_1056_cov_13.032771_g1496_i0.p2 GENE.NODE_1837_length_1056_cov_13.032771_g1496_i0~~NODE_1837_length_1056_cov_13.032771_g1496_i0.p2  ORF type:complete len:133 (-),score=31.50 NODE_1837_length_1056_cov_13.032771_g1496_i0:161-559(-)
MPPSRGPPPYDVAPAAPCSVPSLAKQSSRESQFGAYVKKRTLTRDVQHFTKDTLVHNRAPLTVNQRATIGKSVDQLLVASDVAIQHTEHLLSALTKIRSRSPARSPKFQRRPRSVPSRKANAPSPPPVVAST